MLELVGADVAAWFDAMPLTTRQLPQKRPAAALGLGPLQPGGARGAAHHGGGKRAAGASDTHGGTANGGFEAGGVQPGRGSAIGHSYAPQQHPGQQPNRRGAIDQYYLSRHCAVCDELTRAAQPLCEGCMQDPRCGKLVWLSRASVIISAVRDMCVLSL